MKDIPAVGARIRRNEDERLLTGNGRFIDDIQLEGALSVAFVRSSIAHGRILSVDTSAAMALQGVYLVATCDSIGYLDTELPLLIPDPSLTHPRTQRPLARDEVHYVGQTVAMVVAEDRYVAEDAADLVEVVYEPLVPVVGVDHAVASGAPAVHSGVPGNVAAHCVQVSGDPKAAFASADHVTRATIRVERSSAAPMEPRAVAARWDATLGDLTVWDGTQAPISVRGGLASLFQLDEHRVRVVAPDVGGGFGQKVLFFYPDEILVPWAAMTLERPVKYIEDRQENFLGSTHERLQVHEIELAATRDGVVLGLRDSFLHDTGAFIPYGLAVAQVAAGQIAGPYRIPNIAVDFKAVYTNTVPVTPYRGCGRPHACFAIERAMDVLADELEIDRFEIRRRNFVAADQFPYERSGLTFADALPVSLDSGYYARALEMLEDALDPAGFRVEQASERARGKYLGLGFAFYIEGTGLGPYEGGHVKIHPITGKVYVNTGLSSQGQGHATSFAQIAADEVGVDPADVVVVEGDTGEFDWGVATFASRAAVVSGNAVRKAAHLVREQVVEQAAKMMEAAPEDIVVEDGKVWVQGVESLAVTLAEVATMSNPLRYAFNKAAQSATQFTPKARPNGPALEEGSHPGLEATDYFSPPSTTWAYGVHGAIVEVDPVTFQIDVKRYVCVHDCGNMINPMIVEGQVIGGVAQGVGGALYEIMDYDADGNLRNASLMEFLMPYATEVPRIELMHLQTPSPRNPLGLKGVGEAGTIPVAATFASAIEDALRPMLDGHLLQVPLSPTLLHAAVIASTNRQRVSKAE
ncbi:MAG: aerobic carbon-monoxide dehydrogenase large subunit [Actinomycetota bacterium]|nr:aerobic carbon-monoxide dehydrogenase large subunit [Actinomycetota bacterium]